MTKAAVGHKPVDPEEKKTKRKKWLLLLLLLLGLVAGGGYLINQYMGNNVVSSDLVSDGDTKLQKVIDRTSDKQALQDAVNKQVEEGYMSVNFTPYATFDTSGKSVDFMLVNAENNHYPIRFEILNAKDEVIYTSSEIPKGYEVKEVQLAKALAAGIYDDYRVKIGYVSGGNVASTFPITIQVQ